ncbi:MAG: glutathionylspermidine synthase family protein [Bacteroidota bacterium]
MVDSRLVEIKTPQARSLEKSGLAWFMEDDNHDYIAPELLQVDQAEIIAYEKNGQDLYNLMIEVAEEVLQKNLLHEIGIPDVAAPLLRYSMANERHLHLLGRFDFAGGLDGQAIKLLEFNADTMSLLPETALLQPYLKELLPRRQRNNSFQFNRVQSRIEFRLEEIIKTTGRTYPSLLGSSLGYEEDVINVDVVLDCASKVGCTDVQNVNLEQVIFSPQEGIFVEVNPEEYIRYDLWYKMVPWEWMLFEEPALFQDLSQIILNQQAIVLNPAFTILLQSKGLLKYMYDRYADHPALLVTSFSEQSFKDLRVVEKPVFGRIGENVKIYQGSVYPSASNEGDYGHFKKIY